MTTKKELRKRALKAWKTRRKAKGVPKEVIEIDEALEIQNTLLKKSLKRKYSKKTRHLAALKAWKTRRATETPKVFKSFPPKETNTVIGKSGKKLIRHLAAVKAWKTRKRNTEVGHEIEMDDADNIV